MDSSPDSPLPPPIWPPPSPTIEPVGAPTLVLDLPHLPPAPPARPVPEALAVDGMPDTFPLMAAQPPMRKRKLGLVVGLSGIVAAVAAGAFVVMNRTTESTAYSLPAAAEAAAESSTVEYKMTMDVNGNRFADLAIAYDTVQQRQRITMNLAAAGLTVDAIIDVANHVGYFDASAFAGLPGAPEDVKWLSFDMEAVSALDWDQALKDQGGNPLDVVPLFLDAIDTQDLGFDEINGEQVKRYAVTVDGEAGLANQPQLAEELDRLGGMPDTVTYDVYVNENNELRRMVVEVEVGGVTTAVDVVITSVGEPVSIDIPPPSDVQDATDLLTGFGN